MPCKIHDKEEMDCSMRILTYSLYSIKYREEQSTYLTCVAALAPWAWLGGGEGRGRGGGGGGIPIGLGFPKAGETGGGGGEIF